MTKLYFEGLEECYSNKNLTKSVIREICYSSDHL